MTTKAKLKSHKELSKESEVELVLWLGFLEDSIDNALLQKRRWINSHKVWDLHTFFVAVSCIDDAIVGLKKFLSFDKEIWTVLKSFRANVRKYKLNDLRNDILHREKIFKLQDKKGKPFLKTPILILGGHNGSKDEYIFGSHRISLPEAFQRVSVLRKEIGKILIKRLDDFYKTGKYEGIIPWTSLRSFGINKRQ
jgi:hypothetical protein